MKLEALIELTDNAAKNMSALNNNGGDYSLLTGQIAQLARCVDDAIYEQAEWPLGVATAEYVVATAIDSFHVEF